MKRAILLALLLGGCAQYYENQAAERQSALRDRCSSYGFQSGTNEYNNCVMTLDQQDTANRQALIGAYIAGQRPMPAPQQPYVIPAPQAAPRSCTSQVAGQTIYTNCY
jgi:hypothetical protein